MRTKHIPVVAATASATTELAAFDAALRATRIANYNLVRLSSVIPPYAEVDPSEQARLPEGDWGDRLYCVYAEQRASIVGEQAWAGIGWVQRLDGKGGLFVEHEGSSEGAVRTLIANSLTDLAAGRPEGFGPQQVVCIGVTCEKDPVCALVLAAYETAPWATL